MKKFVAFAAFVAAVSFTSCGNKSCETTEEPVAETETVVVEEVAPVVEEAVADSTATVEAAPAE